jgi:hypothetical protein
MPYFNIMFLYRSPLKLFIVVCVVCIFSTLVAGSGLYKAVSEDKYSSMKNTHNNYNTVQTEDDFDDSDTKHVHLLNSDVEDKDSMGLGKKSGEKLDWIRELFPNSATLFLCAVGFLASYGEGGMVTWSVIYYERYMSVSDTFNSLGYVTFMICMACGRFACDTLR